MIVRVITLQIKEGAEQAFEQATLSNHNGSLKEPGVLRFDVLKDSDQPRTYYLYEAYVDEAATLAHKETEHYHTWKRATGDLIESVSRSASTVVAPTSADLW